jgi:two-component system response regulator VicR
MVAAKSSEVDRVLGLETGADDYLVKPLCIPEFLARVKAQLRRPEQYAERDSAEQSIIGIGSMFVDIERRTLDTDDNYSFTFITPGTYQYFCYLHPKMVG